ncbi:transcription elongation factor SPT6, partial [Phenoliferia sp. Uapishka_3]
MSTADLLGRAAPEDDDMDADAEGEEAEGEGVDIGPGAEDSSEEDTDDDSEEERQLRAGKSFPTHLDAMTRSGFYLEEEDSGLRSVPARAIVPGSHFIEDEEDTTSRKKKKRRKHKSSGEDGSRKRRKDSDDGADDLDEDDLDLLEENTGQKLGGRNSGGHKLKRLRRRRSVSGGSDASGGEGGNLADIFDDDDVRGEAADPGNLFDADEMAGFIEDDTQSDSSGRHGSDSEDDRRSRKQKQKKRTKTKKARGPGRSGFGAGMVEGITAEAWQEVTDVFGNGADYADALEDDIDAAQDKALKDIYDPAEIESRMLTEADDAIRAIDIPERMQLASAGLPSFPPTESGPAPYIAEEDLEEAATWMASPGRISARATDMFLNRDDNGNLPPLHDTFLQAVQNTIKFMNVEFLEVPFIWNHRTDFLVFSDPSVPGETVVLLELADLWRISALSVKYRSFANRKQDLRNLYSSLDVEDDYFEDIYGSLDNVEEVADANDWLAMKYAQRIAEVNAVRDGAEELRKVKRATRESRYENAKRSVISKLAEAVGVSATELSQDFATLNKTHFADDPEKLPLDLAQEFTKGEGMKAEVTLSIAKMILVHEISKDPMLKKEARRFFKDYGVVSVVPTEKGLDKIDEMHPFFNFKYLKNKPIVHMYRTAQFLQILSAEEEDLVKCSVLLPDDASRKFLGDLQKMYKSDYVSSAAEEWNKVRESILEEAVGILVEGAQLWARNLIIEAEEEFVGNLCAFRLDQRIDAAPFMRHDGTMEKGDIPTVLAVSHGAGDPKRDSVIAVYLDSDGHFREHVKLDRLDEPNFGGDPAARETFKDLLERRRPQVIVIGGFSPNTKRLMSDVRQIADEVSQAIVDRHEDFNEEYVSADDRAKRAHFEVIYTYDDVARIYQNSKRAATEFPELSSLGKYCVALARYAQSPLNEYAALGSADLASVTYDQNQKLLRKETITRALERPLMEVTAKVGVDINRAIRNSYYFHLLPYVSGLGPRKASSILQKINGPIGGTLSSRSNLITSQVMTKNIFMNAAAYLRIPQDELNADLKRNTDGEQDKPDILDDTRIHPEDYEVARKMAADAMEYDEEDISGFATASQAVQDVLDDDPEKLDDLSLDDFARELANILRVPKRLTLYAIRDEMKGPYKESRRDFTQPSAMERFTTLTGETKLTLDYGLIIPVRVVRVRADESILCRLDSGIDGIVAQAYRSQRPEASRLRPGELLQALVMELKLEELEVELSTQDDAIRAGDKERRRVQPDQYFDLSRADADKNSQAAILKKSSGRQRRVIKHPNFHNFSAGEAEEYLTHQPRGECVIRPSSKEDHLAVTWKVEDGVFQHIAIFEMNKTNEFSLGSPLKIAGGKYSYIDLDELIFSHVKQMARKVEEMINNEKYKGTQQQLDLFLQNNTMANPGKSAYGFGLDKQRPGQFVVSFRVNQHTEIQSWPIKVVPGAFSLLGQDHGDVMALCTAFKMAYQTRTSNAARIPNSKTPYHQGQTPNPYAGRQTPNPAQRALQLAAGGRTPNPSGRGTPLAGGASPYSSRPPASAYGGGTTPLQQPIGGPSGGQQPWQGGGQGQGYR